MSNKVPIFYDMIFYKKHRRLSIKKQFAHVAQANSPIAVVVSHFSRKRTSGRSHIGSMADTSDPLHVQTPLIESTVLSKLGGFPVYLKLENCQPTGSFKIRGIGNLCQKAAQQGCSEIVSSSGGNSGLAAAYAARKLGLHASIVVPETTPPFTRDRLKDEGAEVEVHGKVWNEANELALKMASKPGCVMVHPFEHPDIWAGHSTMIIEAAKQMHQPPGAIIASVGGGGLMNGILEGMTKVGWQHIPVVAVETEGANCLNAAIQAGKIVTLPGITSIAKCLGSTVVSTQLWDQHKQYKFHSVVVSDKDAVMACHRFADDHRMMVEPGCGAALAVIYTDILHKLQAERKLEQVHSALVIVCGGSTVTMELMNSWKAQFGLV